MKRIGDVFERIIERDNLLHAFALALRGRRQRPEGHWTSAELERWIFELRQDLQSGEVAVGAFHRFVIHDPKRRVIHAAPFRERVLHHAIMNVVGAVFERIAIHDSYACRLGKGAHRARARGHEFSRNHSHFLKLDVQRYFDSVVHEVLFEQLARLFKDGRLLELFRRIIRSYEASPGRGLPIGSLVSQYAANAYLGPLDRFVKQRLVVKGYVRYMDDFVLWHDSVEVLAAWRELIAKFTRDVLRLELKDKQVLGLCSDGLPFLGVRVTPLAIYPSRRSRRRLRRKLCAYESEHALGRLADSELQRRASALLGAVAHTSCLDWRRRELAMTRADA